MKSLKQADENEKEKPKIIEIIETLDLDFELDVILNRLLEERRQILLNELLNSK